MNSRNLIIIGASGHGKVVAEIAERLEIYKNIYFIDDLLKANIFSKHYIIGSTEILEQYRDNFEYIVAIGNNKIRKQKLNHIKKLQLKLSTLIHPDAIISPSAFVGPGTVIMAGAVINPSVTIGSGCIINTNSSVDHDSNIGSFSHVSPGVTIAGTVDIGENVWMGVGSKVINNIKIGNNITIGAGSLVLHDILEEGTYVGTPVRKIK